MCLEGAMIFISVLALALIRRKNTQKPSSDQIHPLHLCMRTQQEHCHLGEKMIQMLKSMM